MPVLQSETLETVSHLPDVAAGDTLDQELRK